jgi:hypothetical protein
VGHNQNYDPWKKSKLFPGLLVHWYQIHSSKPDRKRSKNPEVANQSKHLPLCPIKQMMEIQVNISTLFLPFALQNKS